LAFTGPLGVALGMPDGGTAGWLGYAGAPGIAMLHCGAPGLAGSTGPQGVAVGVGDFWSIFCAGCASAIRPEAPMPDEAQTKKNVNKNRFMEHL